jgi:hypothetical protein
MFSLAHSAVISGQQILENVPAATDTKAAIEERCFLCCLCREMITRTVGAMSSVEFRTGGCEDMTWAREGEQTPLLGAVARDRRVMTAGWKRLSGCSCGLWNVEISGGAVTACSSQSCVLVVNRSKLRLWSHRHTGGNIRIAIPEISLDTQCFRKVPYFAANRDSMVDSEDMDKGKGIILKCVLRK